MKTTHIIDTRLFHPTDTAFAAFMSRLSGEKSSEALELAAALVSHATSGEKQICLDLNTCAGKPFSDQFPGADEAGGVSGIKAPDLESWIKALKKSPVIGSPGDFRPMILDEEGRLYLYRLWRYEQRIAAFIAERVKAKRETMLPVDLKKTFHRYFSDSPTVPDWRKVAAFSALTGRFCVISGGPGTGKTHTVTHIMALMLEREPDLRISVCAPTGKAAARLVESMQKAASVLACHPEIRALIPDNAGTIHRLLGGMPGSSRFRRNRSHPLNVDVLIVDEASMVSLSLMARLMDALPDQARLILLGDKDQLASVEAGAVLGDICQAGEVDRFSGSFTDACRRVTGESLTDSDSKGAFLSDCLVELKHSYRFAVSGGIGAVSRAVNAGKDDEALEWIESDKGVSVTLKPLPEINRLEDALREEAAIQYGNVIRADTAEQAFAGLDRFRVLCAHREGLYGVSNMNRAIRRILLEQGLVEQDRPFFHGRPVIVNRNDYTLNLYNGDVGLVWEQNKDNVSRVFFPDKEGGLRTVAPGRLPDHDDVYAMTIHKSQGSEFDRILLILPDRESPVLTRELIYTGITRARKHVEIWAKQSIFRKAVTERLSRRSGLKTALSALDRDGFHFGD